MCSQTPVAVIELAPVAASAPMVRRFLARHHCPQHGAELRERAALLVTELVANAIKHGSPPIVVSVECDESHDLVVRVRDANRRPPAARTADEAAEDGRGLTIVEIISDEWGVEPTAEGKWVWFRLTGGPQENV